MSNLLKARSENFNNLKLKQTYFSKTKANREEKQDKEWTNLSKGDIVFWIWNFFGDFFNLHESNNLFFEEGVATFTSIGYRVKSSLK
jgi:hypothetical protein